MTTATFSCSIGTTDATVPLGIEIFFDDLSVFNSDHVTGTVLFQQEFSDSEGEHEIRFVLKNKLPENTVINDHGTIISDACLTIKDAAFDDIDLGHMFAEQAGYTHNFNGTQAETTERFYGAMGCNGTVALKFTTPIYLWLLENM